MGNALLSYDPASLGKAGSDTAPAVPKISENPGKQPKRQESIQPQTQPDADVPYFTSDIWTGELDVQNAYFAGKMGNRVALKNSSVVAYLTEEQKKQAYLIGRQESSTIGNIENNEVHDIIETRAFAMSLRRSPHHILSDAEIKSIERDAREIGVDLTILRFNLGGRTGFVDEIEKINIRGDILPDPSGTSVRDRMSQRAVLAHEYYGHYMNHPSLYPEGDWRDEFRASYDAAIRTPNLTDSERRDLMIDAYDRAKEAGMFTGYDDTARRIIYGY